MGHFANLCSAILACGIERRFVRMVDACWVSTIVEKQDQLKTKIMAPLKQFKITKKVLR